MKRFEQAFRWMSSQLDRIEAHLDQALPIDHGAEEAPRAGATGPDRQWEYACHEIGHAWIGWHIAEMSSIRHVKIGETSGECVLTGPARETETQLWAEIAYSLGGIAAEAALLGRFRSGRAQSDLSEAKLACRKLLNAFPQTRTPWKPAPRRKVDMGKAFREPLTERERFILNQGYDIGCLLVERRRHDLVRAALELAQHGLLTGAQLEPFFGDRSAIRMARLTRSGLITFDP